MALPLQSEAQLATVLDLQWGRLTKHYLYGILTAELALYRLVPFVGRMTELVVLRRVLLYSVPDEELVQCGRY